MELITITITITIISFYFFVNGKPAALNHSDYRYFARSERIPSYVSCAELLKAAEFRRAMRRELKGADSVRVSCRRGGSLKKPGRVTASIRLRR